MNYMIHFDDDGYKGETYPVDILMTAEKKEELIANGFIETTEEDWRYYIGANGNGANDTGYVRDPDTGKPVDAPAYIPSKEEQATLLFNECQSDLRQIDEQIVNAIIIKDSELIDELRHERDERIAEYEAALEELEGGAD